MAKRTYRQNCSLALAGDIIGERWTLLLVRDLLISPRRFNELQHSLKGIGSNLLAARLKELELAGVVERQPGKGAAQGYALTGRGRDLEPAVLALIRWGLVHGSGSATGFHHQDDWDLLALKALYRPGRAGGIEARVQFRNGDFTAWVAITAGEIRIGLGEIEGAELVVDGTIKDLFTGDRPPHEWLKAGSKTALKHFMSAFALQA